jgi:hypothetical protein
MIESGFAQPFEPVRRLSTWYTDRTPIDIEIVAKRDAERPEAGRGAVLRLRLERAFVTLLLAQRPGHEQLMISFDSDTGLPSALFSAKVQNAPFREQFPDVPSLSRLDRIRRTVILHIQGGWPISVTSQIGETLIKCEGKYLGNGLSEYRPSRERNCAPITDPGGSVVIARYRDDLSLRISCEGAYQSEIGCSVVFPFQEFSVGVRFHRESLAIWRGVLERAEAFLKSHQYR